MCIGLLVISKTLYQYLYHYIVFWYIYECVMTNGGEMCILLEMSDNQHLVLTRNHSIRLSECITTTATICNNTNTQKNGQKALKTPTVRKCPIFKEIKCKKTSICHVKRFNIIFKITLIV